MAGMGRHVQSDAEKAVTDIRVLLVEDNPGDARLVAVLLEDVDQQAVSLTRASRLSEALTVLDCQCIDAVLLDLSLPDVTGLAGLRQLRQAYPGLPILVLTGAHQDVLALEAIEHGAQDYLQKGSLDGKQLIRAVQYAIERQRSKERVAYLAMHDPLTGLANRRLLQDRFEQALTRARRGDHSVFALYLDLDGFKDVNDRYGHDVGDQLLRMVAERLRECVRESDTVGRVGGDEFVVLLEAVAHVRDVDAVAQKILDALARPFQICEQLVFLPSSIGAAGFPRDGADVDELLARADRAMYSAKESGGHRVCWYASQSYLVRSPQTDLVKDLPGALDQGQLEVYYQPQVDLRTNRVTAVEALLRWNHPSLGLILPSAFLPAVEHGGQMAAIEEWVIRTAGSDYRSWKSVSGSSFRLCINFFARRQTSEMLVKEFLGVLDHGGLSPQDVAIDLPGLVSDLDMTRVRTILTMLHQQGVSVALDDVGTARWSLDALRLLPWDAIKIAGPLVRAMPMGANEVAMIRMFTGFAQELGRQAVAEGVEGFSQLQALRSLGCHEASGAYICQPVSAPQIAGWLQDWNRREMQTAA